MGRIDIGRQFFGSEGSDDLSIGVILAHFQSVGNMMVEMDKLKSFTRIGAIEVAVDFNVTAETPSRPVDLMNKACRLSVLQSKEDLEGSFQG